MIVQAARNLATRYLLDKYLFLFNGDPLSKLMTRLKQTSLCDHRDKVIDTNNTVFKKIKLNIENGNIRIITVSLYKIIRCLTNTKTNIDNDNSKLQNHRYSFIESLYSV